MLRVLRLLRVLRVPRASKLLGWVRLGDGLALLGGAMLPFSLAPFGLWPLALVSAALLFMALQEGSVKRVMLRCYLYNLGMFALGASWIYVSVNRYGGASPSLAAALVALLVLSYSLLALPQAWLYAKLRQGDGRDLLLFPALWTLQEWLRSTILTGFPWLFLGYAFLQTPFDGLAPITGIFGLSFAAALAAALGVQLRRWPRLATLLLAVLASGVVALKWVPFTTPEGTRTVSLLQGNIDQHTKWLRSSVAPILKTYSSLSEAEYGRDILLWPEAAITLPYAHAQGYLNGIAEQAAAAGSTVILGVPDYDAQSGARNTVVSLGAGQGQYVKQRLVPFGEYVPLEHWLRGLIQVLDLPMSRNRPGPAGQAPLTAAGLRLSTSICYEVVYPELVRTMVKSPALLVTVSNDTWFGESIGPFQHLQMAQMRALENGRYMIRATNNGITAIINHRGQLLAKLPQFEAGVLRGQVEIRQGQTPFHRWGSYPTLGACALVALLLVAIRVRRRFR